MGRAGCVDVSAGGRRRRRIRLNDRLYPAATLAWLYMKGTWPLHTIDHINHDGSDDRWDNLREATPTEQSINRRSWGRFARGVSLNHGKYQAHFTYQGKTRYLGTFATEAEAAAAYEKEAELFGYNEYRHAA